MAFIRRPIVASGWANVEHGKVEFDYPAQVVAAIKSWLRHTRSWSGRITVTIAPEVETRRTQANNYYWRCLEIMAEEGIDKNDLHEIMKATYNYKVVEVLNPKTGEVEEHKIPQSTAKLNVEEFSVYLEKVMLHGAEWYGIVFPPADKEHKSKREKSEAA